MLTLYKPCAEAVQPIRLRRFQDVKSNYVGAEGTPERAEYETEL